MGSRFARLIPAPRFSQLLISPLRFFSYSTHFSIAQSAYLRIVVFMKEFLTRDEVVSRLKVELGAGAQKEFAERVGISQQYLCDLLRSRRSPAGKVLEYLGIEAVEQLYRDMGRKKR